MAADKVGIRPYWHQSRDNRAIKWGMSAQESCSHRPWVRMLDADIQQVRLRNSNTGRPRMNILKFSLSTASLFFVLISLSACLTQKVTKLDGLNYHQARNLSDRDVCWYMTTPFAEGNVNIKRVASERKLGDCSDAYLSCKNAGFAIGSQAFATCYAGTQQAITQQNIQIQQQNQQRINSLINQNQIQSAPVYNTRCHYAGATVSCTTQ